MCEWPCFETRALNATALTVNAGPVVLNDAGRDVAMLSVTLAYETLLSLGAFVFSRWPVLRRVDLPASLTSIKEYAFFGCNELLSVVIPSAVESLGSFSFANCLKLERAVFEEPASLVTIERGAFENCEALEFTVPESVLTVGPSAFYNLKCCPASECSETACAQVERGGTAASLTGLWALLPVATLAIACAFYLKQVRRPARDIYVHEPHVYEVPVSAPPSSFDPIYELGSSSLYADPSGDGYFDVDETPDNADGVFEI